jgi:hypothetical protein
VVNFLTRILQITCVHFVRSLRGSLCTLRLYFYCAKASASIRQIRLISVPLNHRCADFADYLCALCTISGWLFVCFAVIFLFRKSIRVNPPNPSDQRTIEPQMRRFRRLLVCALRDLCVALGVLCGYISVAQKYSRQSAKSV